MKTEKKKTDKPERKKEPITIADYIKKNPHLAIKNGCP